MTGLFVQFEVVKAMSATESLLITAGQIFGKKDGSSGGKANVVGSVSQAQAFAAMVNGFGG